LGSPAQTQAQTQAAPARNIHVSGSPAFFQKEKSKNGKQRGNPAHPAAGALGGSIPEKKPLGKNVIF
jgi:hypothetical protein